MGQASPAEALTAPRLRAWSIARRVGPGTRRVPAGAVAALPDEAVMARVQGGCGASFDALVARHYGTVVNFAARMTGRRDLAADVAQHVFVTVYEQRRRYRPGSPFRPWLYCIARRRCQALLRRERRSPLVELEDADLLPGGSGPAEEAERREAVGALVRGMRQLPERERAAVVLFHYVQCSYEAIAQVLGCSPGAARTAACRGRARLRRLLSEEDS